VLFMALLVSLNARAGHITICPDGEDAPRAPPAGVPFFSPERERLRIHVSDESSAESSGDTSTEVCETLALDVEGADVLWIGPVPAADAARARSVPIAVVLQGIAGRIGSRSARSNGWEGWPPHRRRRPRRPRFR